MVDLAEQAGAERVPTDYDSIVVRDVDGASISDDALEQAFDRLVEAITDEAPSIEQALDRRSGALSDADRTLLRYVLASEVEHEFAADAGDLSVDSIDEGEEYAGGDESFPADSVNCPRRC